MYTIAIPTVTPSIFVKKLFKIINKNASTDANQCIDSYFLSLIADPLTLSVKHFIYLNPS